MTGLSARPKRAAAGSPVVVVTGAGRGIGRATAEAFGRDGYRVVVAEIREALARETASALQRSGAEAVSVRTDVTDAGSVRNVVRTTLRQLGRSIAS